jgi:organic hydroperoxide reductase OsmC/OhrA
MPGATVAPHTCTARIAWTGDLGEGTSAYSAYSRRHRISVEGKPDLFGSADPAFRGDAGMHNPEDLFLASLSACHMLFFLSLCARDGIRVTTYEDEAQGRIERQPGGGGRFAEITLRPVVTVTGEEAVQRARQLHETAHRLCFIANSCSVPIRIEATVEPHRDGPADTARSGHRQEER